MACCNPQGYRAVFGERTAQREARRYRRRGLPGSARWLRQSLAAGGIDGRTLLEVGGGVGGLQIELIEAGAASAVNVELIDTYEPAARALLAERSLADRVTRVVADFAAAGGKATDADIVILHRVLCCYPDAPALTAAACARARDRIAVTLPRRSWWIRLGVWGQNAFFRVRRTDFRVYVHDPNEIVDIAGRHGFRHGARTRGAVWESLVLEAGR